MALRFGLLCLAVWFSSLRWLDAATVVKSNGEKVYGAVVSRDDAGVVLRQKGDKLTFVPAASVKEVLNELPAAELEKLNPKDPPGYFTLGQTLLKSEDPEVAAVGARLLRIAAKLSPDVYYRKAYLALYQGATDPADRFAYGSALLAFDPNDAELRGEIQALAEKRKTGAHGQYATLIRGVRAWSDGRTAAALYWIGKVNDADVLDFASRETGMDFRLLRAFALYANQCPKCKGTLLVAEESTQGTGRVLCADCKGTGQVREDKEHVMCGACKGFGTLDSPESKGKGVLPCKTCEDLLARLRLTRPDATAVGALGERIVSLLAKGDPDLKSSSMLEKVPASGKPVFLPDDYAKIVYRNGEWGEGK